MRHHRLRKDLDEYLSHRAKPQKKKISFKDFFVKKQFKEGHITMKDSDMEHLQGPDKHTVVVIDKDPNFFKVLHDKVMSWFKKEAE